jgi:uncharacterized integral membrane protein
MHFKLSKSEKIELIAALVVFIFLIVFAIQNFHERARVHLLFWQTDRTSISIIIFVSVLIGVGIASVELVPHLIRFRKRAKAAESELARLQTFSTRAKINQT